MNIVLWIAQGLLAALYLFAGGLKTFNTAKSKDQFPWAKDASQSFIRFIGISELLGALGVILPLLFDVMPWLTTIAAIGLTMIQLLAIFTIHLPRKEYSVIPFNSILLFLSAFIVYGRWELLF